MLGEKRTYISSKPDCSGKANLFTIIGSDLVHSEVHNRIPPFQHNHPVFIENRCLRNMKPRCNGAMVAVKEHHRTDWKFAVVSKITYITSSFVDLFVWNGLVDEVKGLPIFLTNKNLKYWEDYSTQFDLIRHQLESIDLFWLNQINGECPGDQLIKSDTINAIDGCYQASKSGPDYLLPLDSVPICASSKERITSRDDPVLPEIFKKWNENRKRGRHKCYPRFLTPPNFSVDNSVGQFTVYVEDTLHRTEVPDVLKDCLFVPFYTRPGTFSVITKKNYKALIRKYCDGVHIPSQVHDFEDHLRQISEQVVSYVVVDERNHINGVRIKLVSSTFFEGKNHCHDVRVKSSCIRVLFGNEMGPIEDGTGHLISWIIRDKKLNPVKITQADIRIFRKAYGIQGGFGHRSRCAVIGHNTYTGRRSYHCVSRPTPCEGTGEARNYNYHRSHFNPKYQPGAEKLSNQLARAASYSATWLDPIITGLCPFDKNDQDQVHLCRASIVTMGTPSKSLGFANSLHIDSCDVLCKEVREQRIDMVRQYINSRTGRIARKAKYAMDFIHKFGLGVPTSCVYQFIHDENGFQEDDAEVIQYFLLNGLGVCFRLGNHVAHSFYAFTMTHCTAVCMVVVDSTLYLRKNDNFTVFAWGSGGPKDGSK